MMAQPKERGRYDVTVHARDAFRIHHEGVDFDTVLEALDASIEIDTGVALNLVGRPGKVGKTRDRYRLAPDRRGLFVDDNGTVVTYLRFQQTQEDFALKHWPIEETETPEIVEEIVEEPEEESNVIQMPKPHLEHLTPSRVVVKEGLERVMGNKNRARRALERSVLIKNIFDEESWTQVDVLTDPKTQTRFISLSRRDGPAGQVGVIGLLDEVRMPIYMLLEVAWYFWMP